MRMATMHTPPIDQYDVDEQQEEHQRDDREVGFVFPDENGDVDEPAVAAGQGRLNAVLGW
jgi:hypothetical protein